MSKLRDEFLGLASKREYKKKDIYERLQDFEDDQTRKCFKNSYGNLLLEDLIPIELKNERDSDILVLYERKEKKLPTDDPNKIILQYLIKVMRKAISIDSVPSKLYMIGLQTMLLSAYISDDLKSKQSILNRVKSIIGLSTSIKEQDETRKAEHKLFEISERIEQTIPDKFEDSQVAKVLVSRINQIKTLPDREQYSSLDKLLKKIDDSISSKDEIFTEDDFSVLVYYKLFVERMLEQLDEI
jgi:hypothetical protein